MSTETFVLTAEISDSIRRMTRDMRIVGWYYIIMGGITCLGIITAIFGVPMLIAGLRLKESADRFTSYRGSGDLTTLHNALEKQRSFFFLMMIFIVLGLIFMVVYIIFLFYVIGTMGLQGFTDFSSIS